MRDSPSGPSPSPDPDHEGTNAALTEWSFNWRKNGWRTSGGVSVLNKELIDYTLTLLETRQRAGQPVSLEYVKGHSGDVGNDGADALAVAGCDFTEKPDRDWVKLKNAYVPGQDVMDVDPVVSPGFSVELWGSHSRGPGLRFE